MDLGFLSIDFDGLFNAVWSALYRFIRIPFRLINNLPEGFKIGILAFLMLFMIMIAFLVWKYRDEWRYREM